MAARAGDRDADALEHVEPRGYFDDAFASDDEPDQRPDEDSPLLASPEIKPSKWFTRKVLAMCILFLFIAEVSTYIMDPPIQAIMEDVICREHHPDHALNSWDRPDPRCKDEDVQGTLTMVRSWQVVVESLVPALVQIPFGIIADKYGRRPVLILSFVGCILNLGWFVVVLGLPDVFSIWAVLLGCIPFLLGGGSQMTVAMLYTITSDIVPPADLSKLYFFIRALILTLHVVITPIAAMLMSKDAWTPMWLGWIAVVFGAVTTFFVPETVQFRQKPDAHAEYQGAPSDDQDVSPTYSKNEGVVAKAWKSTANIRRFARESRPIMILAIAYSIDFSVQLAFVVYRLQYMTKRYDWSWSTATYVTTFGYLAAVVVLLFILPLASSLLTSYGGLGPLKRDLVLSQASLVFTGVGALLTAVAASPWVMIGALLTCSLGTGFTSICRALMVAVVEPHHVATLNTIISMLEASLGLVSAPLEGWLLKAGLRMGGAATGLLYYVIFGVVVLMSIPVFLFKIPAKFSSS